MVGPERPQFVLFGSSIVQFGYNNEGWVAILANIYARKVTPFPVNYFPSSFVCLFVLFYGIHTLLRLARLTIRNLILEAVVLVNNMLKI